MDIEQVRKVNMSRVGYISYSFKTNCLQASLDP